MAVSALRDTDGELPLVMRAGERRKGVWRSILVTLLNPLDTNGYVSRKRDPTDRRRHVVNLTRRGEQRLDRAAQAQRDAENEILASLTPAQRHQLRNLLLILRDHIAG